MATVHLGQLVGPAGFSRTVAMKRLGAALVEDRDAVAMLLDEARLAARLHHPNVAATIDVVVERTDAYIIMEYVHGESLARLLRGGTPPAPAVVSAIVVGALRGLHAAHEVCDERGEPLEIIHRDVSPENIIVGADGAARLIDFGIAKARSRLQATTEGQLKGKLSYLAPEQIRGASATRRTDLYAAGVVLWEALTGKRLFDGDCAGAITEQILVGWVERPSKHAPDLPEAVDTVVLRALETEPARRFPTAAAMAEALERAMAPAPAAEVAEWVVANAGKTLAQRAEMLHTIKTQEAAEERARRLRVSRRVIASLAAILLCVGVVILFTGRGAPGESQLLAAERHASGDIANRRGSEPATAPPDAPKLAAEPLPAAPNRARVEPAAAPSAPPRKIVRSPRVPPSSGPARARKESCTPPYEVSDDGIRIYKRACLGPS
jgi:serine/threonine-protein kinase